MKILSWKAFVGHWERELGLPSLKGSTMWVPLDRLNHSRCGANSSSASESNLTGGQCVNAVTLDMSTNSTHEFPSLVGGLPLPVDYAPSILFACLYAIMVPVVIWRRIHPQSRSFVFLGTVFFSIER